MRGLKNPDHRDEKYDARVLELSSKVNYDASDLTVVYPSKRSMHDRFDPDNDDHWTEWPDLGSLWYDHSTHRDANEKWTVSFVHRPYDKRRSSTISGLTYARRPRIDMKRWRSQVDEVRVYTLSFTFRILSFLVKIGSNNKTYYSVT